MMMTRRLTCVCTALLLLLQIGCEVNRARSRDLPPQEALAAEHPIEIPGPYFIGDDGTVDYRSIPRPNGHMLGTRISNGLPRQQAKEWIQRTARAMGGTTVYVRSIVGPYLLDPDEPVDEDNPKVYDVVIEVWEPRADEHDHS